MVTATDGVSWDHRRMSECTPDPGIRLRPLRAEDAVVIGGWGSDPVFVAHAGWTPDLPVEEYVRFWREDVIGAGRAEGPMAAVLHGDVVGTLDLHGDGEIERELGYTVGPSSRWGRGLGSAIARAGLELAFGERGLDAVWAEALPPNTASVRILERLGMRATGEGGSEEFLGEPSRYRQYRITREQWWSQAGRSAASAAARSSG